MTPTTLEKLKRIQNYATRYEVALSLSDGRKLLVCYTPRKNRAGLLSAIQERGKAILAQMPDLSDDATMSYAAATGFNLGTSAQIPYDYGHPKTRPHTGTSPQGTYLSICSMSVFTSFFFFICVLFLLIFYCLKCGKTPHFE